jgi:hypothetical protein
MVSELPCEFPDPAMDMQLTVSTKDALDAETFVPPIPGLRVGNPN